MPIDPHPHDRVVNDYFAPHRERQSARRDSYAFWIFVSAFIFLSLGSVLSVEFFGAQPTWWTRAAALAITVWAAAHAVAHVLVHWLLRTRGNR